MKPALRFAPWLVLAFVFAQGTSAPAQTEKSSKTQEKSKAKDSADAKTPIDLNSATHDELIELPGVGVATAKKIIAGRPYKTIDDLTKAGIPASTIAKFKAMATVKPPAAAKSATAKATVKKAEMRSAKDDAGQKAVPAAKRVGAKSAAAKKELAPGEKININKATSEELQKLYGIGPVHAEDIIKARPFAKPEDIMKVKGIKDKEYEKIKDNITVK